jgi:hypothetical protein
MPPVRLINVRLELDKYKMDEEVKRLASKDGGKVVTDLLQGTSQSIAEHARRRMANVLDPDHRFRVGASGKAARNIYVESSGGGKNASVEWNVMEGRERTKANYFIRQGFDGSKNGKLPPEAPIRLWLANKKIRVKSPDDYLSGNKKATSVRYIKSKSGKGRPYGRSYNNKNIAEAALFAIRKHIAKWGSRYSHWNDLYPKGQGRFDYPAYIIKVDRGFEKFVERSVTFPLTGYIDWLASGRTPAAGRVIHS